MIGLVVMDSKRALSYLSTLRYPKQRHQTMALGPMMGLLKGSCVDAWPDQLGVRKRTKRWIDIIHCLVTEKLALAPADHPHPGR